MQNKKFDKIKIIHDVTCVDTNISAIQIFIPNYGLTWIPEKEINIESEVKYLNDHGRLVISQWLADQKGL